MFTPRARLFLVLFHLVWFMFYDISPSFFCHSKREVLHPMLKVDRLTHHFMRLLHHHPHPHPHPHVQAFSTSWIQYWRVRNFSDWFLWCLWKILTFTIVWEQEHVHGGNTRYLKERSRTAIPIVREADVLNFFISNYPSLPLAGEREVWWFVAQKKFLVEAIIDSAGDVAIKVFIPREEQMSVSLLLEFHSRD